MTETILYPIQDLLHRTVVDKEGRKLGDVETLACDPLTWHVEGVAVHLTREAMSRLRLRHEPFQDRVITIPAAHVTVTGDYLRVDEPETAIRSAFERQHSGYEFEGSPESV